jgi:hypothetical protein
MRKQSDSGFSAVCDAAVIAAVEAEISRIQTLKPEEVRALWRSTFKREVPKALILFEHLCPHLIDALHYGWAWLFSAISTI